MYGTNQARAYIALIVAYYVLASRVQSSDCSCNVAIIIVNYM